MRGRGGLVALTAAQAAGQAGQWAAWLAVVYAAISEPHAALWVAVVTFAWSVPQIFAAAIGRLVDAWGPRCTGTMAWLVTAGLAEAAVILRPGITGLAVILAAAALTGTWGIAAGEAVPSWLPGRPSQTEGGAALSAATSITIALAALTGTWLVVHAGQRGAWALAAGLSAVGALISLLIPAARPVPPPGGPGGGQRDRLPGPARRMLALTCGLWLVLGAVTALEALYVVQVLHARYVVYGWLLATYAAAGIVASAAASRWPRLADSPGAVTAAALLLAAGLPLYLGTTRVLIAFTGAAVFGAGASLARVAIRDVLTGSTPAHRHGRVTALWESVQALALAAPLPAVGVLVTLCGLRPVLYGTCVLAAAVALAYSGTRARRAGTPPMDRVARDASVSRSHSRVAANSGWHVPGPRQPPENGDGLQHAGFPCSGACLVASDDPDPGYVAQPGASGGGRFPPGGDALAFEGLYASAERFLTLFYAETGAGAPGRRLWQVRRQIAATGTYWHTAAELEFGARVAWRNSSRCIGRLYWHSLRVRDRREVSAAGEVAAESVAHLREATNGGRIRPTITVFAPDAPGWPGPRIHSPQLIRYAGYQTPGGRVTGDPANLGITRLARDLGWPGGQPPGRFDILPLVIEERGTGLETYPLPPDAVLEVTISHPDFAWFTDLGLRWHAVPVISDMYLEIGGISYPAAPFNGWYMCTEIGSRNLGDTARYNQLPLIARAMGLATAIDQTLWKDKAITELNLAVLHSFTTAGVTITDHHTESARFLQHIEREARHGRACPADWTWIVPPTASSATPVFHRYYQDFDASPNFHRHPPPPQTPARFRGWQPGAAAQHRDHSAVRAASSSA